MAKVTPIRSVNPQGRVDVLVSRLIEESLQMLVRPRSPELWGVLKPHVQAIAKRQVRKLGVTRRPLTPEELQLIERVLNPRGLKCTA